MLIELQRQLFRQRQAVKPRRLGENRRDLRSRQIVAGEDEEPDLGGRRIHLVGGGGEYARPAGEIIGNVDDGDGLGH